MDDFSINGNVNQPLYNGTDLTTCAAICLIMQFALCNNLTNEAIEKLLKPLNLLLPSPNHLPKSYYKLKAFLSNFLSPTNIQKFVQYVMTTQSTVTVNHQDTLQAIYCKFHLQSLYLQLFQRTGNPYNFLPVALIEF